MMTVAIFGGTFDPPHIAHVLVACWAQVAAEIDEVLVVPTFQHAFGKTAAPYEHRRRMTELAMRDLRKVEISDIERDLGGESRTYHTLVALRERRPDASFRLVVGADILGQTQAWHRWEDIAAMAPPLVVGRRGYPLPPQCPIAMPDVSSTEIRARLRRGEPTTGLLPPAVASYIAAHGLYGSAAR